MTNNVTFSVLRDILHFITSHTHQSMQLIDSATYMGMFNHIFHSTYNAVMNLLNQLHTCTDECG